MKRAPLQGMLQASNAAQVETVEKLRRYTTRITNKKEERQGLFPVHATTLAVYAAAQLLLLTLCLASVMPI
jgi:hypothetical protein